MARGGKREGAGRPKKDKSNEKEPVAYYGRVHSVEHVEGGVEVGFVECYEHPFPRELKDFR